MKAGLSAAQEAERSRRAAGEHRRRAAAADRRAAAFEAGRCGEEIAAQTLQAVLPPGCHVWHDVRWPGRPIGNVDGVVLGPFGLLVWDAKHWSGRLTVSDGSLRQNGHQRDDKLHAARQAAAAVIHAGGLPPIGLPVLLLTGTAGLPQPTSLNGVTVLNIHHLSTWLERQPNILSPAAVSGMSQLLDAALTPAARPTAEPRRTRAGTRLPDARVRPTTQLNHHGSTGHRSSHRAGATRLALAAALAAVAATGLLGRMITPAASWFGHHEAKLITKQVTPAPQHPKP